jgi:CubicO group peptidase (beta-lactamase class C family)
MHFRPPIAAVLCVLLGSALPAVALAERAAAVSTLPSAPVSITGRWEGEIKTPGPVLKIDIDFTPRTDAAAAYSGDISIPMQGAKDLPLTDISLSGTSVAFKIANVPGDPAFAGELSDDSQSITGTMTQGGVGMPFSLRRAAAPEEAAKDALNGWDAFADSVRDQWHAAGVAMAIVKDGKILLSKGYGYRDVEAKAPVTEKTIFAIGSSTKAFTTFVMGTLVDDGKLDWNKPVRDWIPEFKLADATATDHITPLDLVTHRSGMPRHDLMWYGTNYTRAEMVRRMQYLEFNEDFRTAWQYNNLMYLTAGYLVERITGKSWEDNVRARIFEPLHMSRSNFSVADSQKSDDFAFPYDEHEDAARRIDFRDISNIGPAGSINSSITDMSAWLRVQLGSGEFEGRRIIQAPTLKDLHTPHMTMGGDLTPETETLPVGYGLGWFIDVYRGVRRVHHGGNIDGFSCLVTLVPDKDLGIVVLVNQNGSAVPGLLTNHALDRLLALPTRAWSDEALARRATLKATIKEGEKLKEVARVTGTTPSHALADFTGDYEHPAYGTISIALAEGDALSISFNGFTLPLEHWHYDVFSMGKVDKLQMFDGQKVQFTTGLDGAIESLRVAAEPSVKAQEFKKKPDAKYTDPSYLSRFEGEYALGQQTVSFVMRGTALVLTVPGQPAYTMKPTRDNTFDLEGLAGYSVHFIIDDNGKTKEAQFRQPNGVFNATRK